jgi:tetratricopeptide (TPR) repeat protein
VALAPEHSLVRAAQGHATLAAEDHTTAATALAKLAKLAAELEPRLGQAAPMSPVQPPGPCGVSLDPTPFAWWLAQLGQAWAAANAGDHPLALDHHNAILARQPQERLATLGAGLALMNMGRPDEAIAMVQPLTTTWPSDPFVLAELEVLAAVQQQDADAEASWERELARGGEPSTCPYEGLGLTYLSQGRTDEAKVQLERSIELDPDLGFRKYNALARILMDEGDLAGAHAMLDKSAANHPGNPEAEELLRTLARLEAEAATP